MYYKLTMWPAHSWLDSSVGRALHWYHRGHGLESPLSLNFFLNGIVWFLFVTRSEWRVFVAIWLVREATRDILDVIILAVTWLSSFSPGWLIPCNAKLNKNWPEMLTSKMKTRLKYLIHETPSIKGDGKQAKKPWKTNEDDTKAELEDL